MKQIAVITDFDGAKFAARYSLNPFTDFHVEGTTLFFPDTLPDTPIQETVDTPQVSGRLKAELLLDNFYMAPEVLLRALALVTMDELNNLRQWLTDFKAATAGAATFAALKTAIAALPNVPQRTKGQIMPAIRTKIQGGTADTGT